MIKNMLKIFCGVKNMLIILSTIHYKCDFLKLTRMSLWDSTKLFAKVALEKTKEGLRPPKCFAPLLETSVQVLLYHIADCPCHLIAFQAGYKP